MREFNEGLKQGLLVGLVVGLWMVAMFTLNRAGDMARDIAILRTHGCYVQDARTTVTKEGYVRVIPYQSRNIYVCPATITEGDMAWLDDLKKAHY